MTKTATPTGLIPEYMFGIKDGFDIIIANPPYIQLQSERGRLRKLYEDCGYETLVARGDVYQLFYERGCQLLQRSGGLLAYITSNSWLRAEYGRKTRGYFAERHTPLLWIDLGMMSSTAPSLTAASFCFAPAGRPNHSPPSTWTLSLSRNSRRRRTAGARPGPRSRRLGAFSPTSNGALWTKCAPEGHR